MLKTSKKMLWRALVNIVIGGVFLACQLQRAASKVGVMHYGSYGGLMLSCQRNEMILMESEKLGFSSTEDCDPQPPCSVPYTLANWYCRGKTTCSGMQVERRPLHRRTCGSDFTNCLRVEYQCVPKSQLTDICSEVEYETIGGHLVSPSFPEMYPPGQNCTCSLTSDPNGDLRLASSLFILKAGRPCSDWLKVEVDGVARATMCGYIPSERFFTGSEMMVNFRSDYSGQEMGFWLKFSASASSPIKVTCGPKAFKGRDLDLDFDLENSISKEKNIMEDSNIKEVEDQTNRVTSKTLSNKQDGAAPQASDLSRSQDDLDLDSSHTKIPPSHHHPWPVEDSNKNYIERSDDVPTGARKRDKFKVISWPVLPRDKAKKGSSVNFDWGNYETDEHTDNQINLSLEEVSNKEPLVHHVHDMTDDADVTTDAVTAAAAAAEDIISAKVDVDPQAFGIKETSFKTKVLEQGGSAKQANGADTEGPTALSKEEFQLAKPRKPKPTVSRNMQEFAREGSLHEQYNFVDISSLWNDLDPADSKTEVEKGKESLPERSEQGQSENIDLSFRDKHNSWSETQKYPDRFGNAAKGQGHKIADLSIGQDQGQLRVHTGGEGHKGHNNGLNRGPMQARSKVSHGHTRYNNRLKQRSNIEGHTDGWYIDAYGNKYRTDGMELWQVSDNPVSPWQQHHQVEKEINMPRKGLSMSKEERAEEIIEYSRPNEKQFHEKPNEINSLKENGINSVSEKPQQRNQQSQNDLDKPLENDLEDDLEARSTSTPVSKDGEDILGQILHNPISSSDSDLRARASSVPQKEKGKVMLDFVHGVVTTPMYQQSNPAERATSRPGSQLQKEITASYKTNVGKPKANDGDPKLWDQRYPRPLRPNQKTANANENMGLRKERPRVNQKSGTSLWPGKSRMDDRKDRHYTGQLDNTRHHFEWADTKLSAEENEQQVGSKAAKQGRRQQGQKQVTQQQTDIATANQRRDRQRTNQITDNEVRNEEVRANQMHGTSLRKDKLAANQVRGNNVTNLRNGQRTNHIAEKYVSNHALQRARQQKGISNQLANQQSHSKRTNQIAGKQVKEHLRGNQEANQKGGKQLPNHNTHQLPHPRTHEQINWWRDTHKANKQTDTQKSNHWTKQQPHNAETDTKLAKPLEEKSLQSHWQNNQHSNDNGWRYSSNGGRWKPNSNTDHAIVLHPLREPSETEKLNTDPRQPELHTSVPKSDDRPSLIHRKAQDGRASGNSTNLGRATDAYGEMLNQSNKASTKNASLSSPQSDSSMDADTGRDATTHLNKKNVLEDKDNQPEVIDIGKWSNKDQFILSDTDSDERLNSLLSAFEADYRFGRGVITTPSSTFATGRLLTVPVDVELLVDSEDADRSSEAAKDFRNTGRWESTSNTEHKVDSLNVYVNEAVPDSQMAASVPNMTNILEDEILTSIKEPSGEHNEKLTVFLNYLRKVNPSLYTKIRHNPEVLIKVRNYLSGSGHPVTPAIGPVLAAYGSGTGEDNGRGVKQVTGKGNMVWVLLVIAIVGWLVFIVLLAAFVYYKRSRGATRHQARKRRRPNYDQRSTAAASMKSAMTNLSKSQSSLSPSIISKPALVAQGQHGRALANQSSLGSLQKLIDTKTETGAAMQPRKYREVPIDVPPELVRSYQAGLSDAELKRPLPPTPQSPQSEAGRHDKARVSTNMFADHFPAYDATGGTQLPKQGNSNVTKGPCRLPPPHSSTPSEQSSTATYKDLQALLSGLNKGTPEGNVFNHANVSSWAVSSFAAPNTKRGKKSREWGGKCSTGRPPYRGSVSDQESSATSFPPPPPEDQLRAHLNVRPPHAYSQTSTPFSSVQDLSNARAADTEDETDPRPDSPSTFNTETTGDPEAVYNHLNRLAAKHGITIPERQGRRKPSNENANLPPPPAPPPPFSDPAPKKAAAPPIPTRAPPSNTEAPPPRPAKLYSCGGSSNGITKDHNAPPAVIGRREQRNQELINNLSQMADNNLKHNTERIKKILPKNTSGFNETVRPELQKMLARATEGKEPIEV